MIIGITESHIPNRHCVYCRLLISGTWLNNFHGKAFKQRIKIYPSKTDNRINFVFIFELKKEYTIINNTNDAIDNCSRDCHEIKFNISDNVAAFICHSPNGFNIPELDIFKTRYNIGDIPTKTSGKLNNILTKNLTLIFL